MKNLLAVLSLSLMSVSVLAAPADKSADKPAAKTGAPVNVTLETSLGTIKLELDAAKAPQTVNNFVEYAKAKHYDGLVFHRVIKGFMVQGGGYDEKFEQRKTRAPVKNEAANGLKNARGTVAMARTGDPHSATSQFFINHADNTFLDYPARDGWGYCVFGKVTEGMDVVDKIASLPTGSSGPFDRDVPMKAVVIKSVTVAPVAGK
jgi:cyclophilin family peptidyl-prolyl cis-trans isomerase